MKMFKEDKEAWLDALRSGEYQQDQYQLYRAESDGYCCLGVLEACLMDGKVEGSAAVQFYGMPSADFYNLFGITDVGAKIKGGDFGYQTYLMGMNDGSNPNQNVSFTFAEIADWIDKNVKTHKRPRSAESQAKLDAVLESL